MSNLEFATEDSARFKLRDGKGHAFYVDCTAAGVSVWAYKSLNNKVENVVTSIAFGDADDRELTAKHLERLALFLRERT